MKRWLKYVKPYSFYFICGPVCMIIEVIGEVVMPKLLANIIDYGTGAVPPSEGSAFVQWVFSVVGQKNSPFIIAIMVGMIMTALLMMAGGVGGAYFGAKAAVNFAADLRADIYRKVQQFSFANIDKFSTGSLVTRLTNDVTQLQNFINMLLRMCLRSPGMLIGGIIMAMRVNPKLTGTLGVSLPLLCFTIFFFMRKALPRFTSMQTKIDRLNSTVQENVTNVRVVKSFVREEHEKEKFAKANAELKAGGMGAMKLMIMMSPAMTFFMNATTIAVYWFGGNMLVKGTMTTGSLTAFITYISQILSSLIFISVMLVMMSRAMASARRIAEVLDEEVDVTDGDLSPEDEARTVENGSVEFKNVRFRYYKHSEERVLENINLKIEAGQTVGVIGSTGSGKSTLVSLIARLYDCDEGEVLVDGVNVRRYSLFHLREGVGFVLQKNVLFSGTIADNLRWGDENATDEEVRKAASYAQASGFVEQFKDGYDTLLDQGGTNVSGGQKQRLCIARALLKKPKILVLDDSTSAVDTATEAKIREAFANELKGATKIIIAQRISSVKDADMIVVVDDGKITGVGTHESLLNHNTEYTEIYYSQVEKEEVTA